MTRGPAVYVKSLIFALVSAVLLLALSTVLGDIRFNSTHGYHAIFDNVSQLQSGDQVRIAGVEVGKVTGVSVVDGSRIRVDFDVDDGVRLASTTRAVVRYKDLVGNRFLELQQSATPGLLLASGATLPTSQTSPALNLDDLFDSFKPLLSGLAPAQINAVSADLVSVLQGQGGSVYRLLATIGSFANTIADNDSLVGQTLNNLTTALGSLDAESGTLSDVLTQLQQLVSGLNQDKTPILDSLDEIQGASAEAAALLSQIRDPLKVDVTQIGALATALNGQQDSLQQFLDKAPALQQTALRLGSHGAFFNFYLCGLTLQLDGVGKLPTVYSNAARCR